VHGSSGLETIEAVIQFIGQIAPGADVRAWLVGDDNPWEMMFRSEAGELECP